MASVPGNEALHHVDQVDVYSIDNNKDCDRRISRAARSLLEQHLRRVVMDKKDHWDGSHTEDDVWTLLEHWLLEATPAECPLLPERDIWRHDEEHSLPIKIPSNIKGVLPSNIESSRQPWSPHRPQHWWKCGYCGKRFMTRFYLDFHMQQQHHHQVQDSSLICPATDWCRIVGVANCYEQALQDEPFYDRGSSGWGDDGRFVRHKWSKVAHSVPCQVETLRNDCHRVLQGCQVGTTWCDDLTCPRHHFWRESVILIPDHWRDLWRREIQHHQLGVVLGIVSCLLLCAWVYSSYQRPSVIASSHPGKRLLQKSPRPRRFQFFDTKRGKRD